MSVQEDRANRKRIFSGFQGYIALKRKTGKKLHAEEIFLSFSALVRAEKLLKVPDLSQFAPPAIPSFRNPQSLR